MFVKRIDFETAIQLDQLDQIIPIEEDYVFNQAIQAGLIEVQSYLAPVFDISKVFPALPEWNANATYFKDEAVWYNNKIYVAKVEILPYSTSGTSPNIDSNWQLNDIRDQKILQVLIDIVLYHIHKRVSPRQVPQHRLFNHDLAINWLTGLRDGKLASNLSKIEEPATNPDVYSVYERQLWRY
jgi:hypothetical protein